MDTVLTSATRTNLVQAFSSAYAQYLPTTGGTISGNLIVTGALSSSSFVDPINYGADPTGQTDSTAAIQAAIFSGIPVRFSPGIYVVSSPLYLPSGAKLEGTGMNLNAIYTSHPLPKETAAIYHANVSYNSTTGSTTYSAPGAGPLFVIHPPNQNITIKDIVLYGAYTTSADNYAIYAVDVPGEGTTRNYSTSQPWQAYNAANWVTSMPSVTTGALTAGTTVITGLSPSDTTFLQPGMSLALYSSSPSVYEEVTVKSYSSGTLTLTLPIKNKYTSSSTILKPFLANMNLRLENVAANYFSGDATIYLGHNRGENKLEHVNIYGAGISGGSGNNANACGIVWNCADSEAKNSVIGACALHGFVLNDTVTAVNGGEIWNCGGNGVYVLGGLQCTIGTRTTFDHHKKEAIYIEAGSNTINNSAAGPGAYFSSLTGTPGCSDVTIEPGVSFSNNCTSFSGTQNAITSNIATDTAWTGRLNVLGNIVLGNLNGTAGVQYHVYLGNTLANLNYTDNMPINNPTTATTYSVVSASGSTITLSGSTAGIVPYVPLTIGSEKKIVDVSYTLNSTTVPLSTTLTGTYSGTTMAAAVGLPYFNGAVYFASYSPYGIANTGSGASTKAGSPNLKANSDDSTVLWYRQIVGGDTYTPVMKFQSATTNSDQIIIQASDSTSPAAYSSALYTQSLRLGTSSSYDANIVRTASGVLTVQNNLIVTSDLTVGNDTTIKGDLTVSGALSSSSFVDPINYGADPTGQTDSTSAIQAAIFSGIPVKFGPGTYVVSSPLYIPTGCLIQGTGPGRASYPLNPAPSETARILHANVSGGSYSTPNVGPLFVLQPSVVDVTIRDLHLDGVYTKSRDNYAIFVPEAPYGYSWQSSYDTTYPWQAYNAANWISNFPSGTTGSLTIGTTVITGFTPSDTTWLVPGMSLAISTNNPYVFEQATVKSYSAGTLTLAKPITKAYTASSVTIEPAWVSGQDTNLFIENVSMFNFAGDATVYLGFQRLGNKFNHLNIYGAGYGASTNPNANACGLVVSCSDSHYFNSLFGASKLHNIVLNSSIGSISQCDIWGAGGNGVYVFGGNRVDIQNRVEFDNAGKEAIYIEGNASAKIYNSAAGVNAYITPAYNGAADVQIGPGVNFSSNCMSGSGTDSAITSNIYTDANWGGRLNVTGNSVCGNFGANGGVQYDLYMAGLNPSINYIDNKPSSYPLTAKSYAVTSASGSTITLTSTPIGLTVGVPLTIGSENKIIDSSYVIGSTTVPLTTALVNTYSNTTMSAAIGLPYFTAPVLLGSYTPFGVANTGSGVSTVAANSNVRYNSDASSSLYYRQAANSNPGVAIERFQSATSNGSDQLIIQALDSASPNNISSLWTKSIRFGSNNVYDTNIVRTASGVLTVQNNLVVTSGLTVSGNTTVNGPLNINTAVLGGITATSGQAAVFNGTSWVPSTISGTATTTNPLAYGNPNVGESFSRYIATVPNTVASGVMRFAGMYLTAGQVVNNITFATTSVASNGITSSWGGIFTTSGTSTTMYLLASTSGQVNPTYAATSVITTALSGSFTVPSNGIYLVGFTFFGTTPPGWVGTGNAGNGLLGAQFPVIMAQASMTSYPTPPAIGTSFSIGGSSYSPWFALT